MLNYNNTEDLDRREAPIFFQKYRRNNFTQISNKAIEDEDLSCESFWLVAYAMSKPDNWRFYCSDIKKQKGFGKKKLSKTIKECEDKRYLYKRAISLGRAKGFFYVWFWNDEKFSDEDIEYLKSIPNKDFLDKNYSIDTAENQRYGGKVVNCNIDENTENTTIDNSLRMTINLPFPKNQHIVKNAEKSTKFTLGHFEHYRKSDPHNNTILNNNTNIYIDHEKNLNFDNFKEEMVEPLKRWCEYKEIGKGQPLNQFSLNETYEFLLTISSGSKEYAERIVSHCILKNWTQLFSIRGENKKPKLKETIYKDKQNYKEIDNASKTESIPIETEIPPKISTEYYKIKDEASEEFLEEVSRCFEINNYKAWLEDIKYTFSGNVVNLYFRNTFVRDFVARDYLQGVCKGDKIIRRGLKDLIKEFYPNIKEIKLI